MMMFHAIGDLAQSISIRRQSASAESDVMRLTKELSSGKTSNVSQHLGGSFGQLADMETQLALKQAYRTAGTLASTQAAMMQSALEIVQIQMTGLAGQAMQTGFTGGGAALGVVSNGAQEVLGTMVSALNTTVAGRAVFAGSSVRTAPLASSAQIMDAARLAVAGSTDASAVMAALDGFFDSAGGGFETMIYLGGTDDLSPHRLGNGEEVSLAIRADDTQIRTALKNTVMAALSGDNTLALSDDERMTLMRASGTAMSVGVDELIGLRADLGTAEERIDQSMTRNAAEQSSLKIARNDLLAVDPFETASALEQAQLRLEMIYTLTARSSRLSLVNFL
ncbi:flagellin [Roseovarius sp. S4756]|uniref:flagellin n=1 Tax=Roseovarius maritimus TaxID=3342637 RepID=UPI00372A3EC8